MFNNHPVESLLDTDLYKISMCQFVLHQFPASIAKFKFKCRTPNINLAKYIQEIKDEINYVSSLKFTPGELCYLSTLKFIKEDYLDFLEDFQLKERHVTVTPAQEYREHGVREINITIEGPWLQTILWEIYILKIVHEVYSKNEHPNVNYTKGLDKVIDKCYKINQNRLKVIEFGSRRAFSSKWHDIVVKEMVEKQAIVGTSNVMLAKKYSINCSGTQAHEIFQACQGLGPRVAHSQSFALQKWADEYRGDLGIALTDTLGIDKFLRDFDGYFSRLYDGVRHDSGDPIEWGEKIINHYKKYKIDPMTKAAVFSDGLNVDKAVEINNYFKDRLNCSFGIGTNLTNDLGVPFLQIVIKMVECNGHPVAKISDNPDKTMCVDKVYLDYLRSIIKE